MNNSKEMALLGVYQGARIAMLGAIGSSIGQCFSAGKAVEAVARNPEAEGKIGTMLIVGDEISEISSIYSLIIAIVLNFFAQNN